MNYNHCNKVHEFWREDIFPKLVHRHTFGSFDNYLRELSFLPSCKWIKELEKVKFSRVAFAVDPIKLVEQFEKQCVTYNVPVKAEDGVQRVIYQVSPTLHFEAAFWIWVEHELINSYASVFVCYHDEKEYLKFVDDLWNIRREGNTEEKPTRPGFFPQADFIDAQSLAKKKEGLDNRQK